MFELEVYAARVRDLNKILEPEPIPELHYDIHRGHDTVYPGLEAGTVTRETQLFGT